MVSADNLTETGLAVASGALAIRDILYWPAGTPDKVKLGLARAPDDDRVLGIPAGSVWAKDTSHCMQSCPLTNNRRQN